MPPHDGPCPNTHRGRWACAIAALRGHLLAALPGIHPHLNIDPNGVDYARVARDILEQIRETALSDPTVDPAPVRAPPLATVARPREPWLRYDAVGAWLRDVYITHAAPGVVLSELPSLEDRDRWLGLLERVLTARDAAALRNRLQRWCQVANLRDGASNARHRCKLHASGASLRPLWDSIAGDPIAAGDPDGAAPRNDPLARLTDASVLESSARDLPRPLPPRRTTMQPPNRRTGGPKRQRR